MKSRLKNISVPAGPSAFPAWLVLTLFALCFSNPLSAIEVEPMAPGSYPVGTTNLRVTDEFAAYGKEQRDVSLNGKVGPGGERLFFSDQLQNPDTSWVIHVEVPDDSKTYGNIAGISLPVVIYLNYPTTPDNNRAHYPFPFPDAEDSEMHHMQGPGEQPIFADDQQRYPLVLISHGRNVHGIWEVTHARRLASHGYITITVNYGDRRISDPGRPFLDTLFRPLAGKAVLDHVLASEAFGGHIDPSRIATSGHSLGGFTSLALAGGRYLDHSGSFSDPRIRAVVAASPWVGGGGFSGDYFLFADKNNGLADIKVPVLTTFGTNDISTPMNTILPAVQNLSGPRYVIELVDQPHVYEPGSWQDLGNWELVFLSAYLKDDPQSLEKLRTGSSMQGGNRDVQHFDLQRLPDVYLWKKGAPGLIN